MRVYPAGSPHMKVLERLYSSPGRALLAADFGETERKHLCGLAARQLVVDVDATDVVEGEDHAYRKFAITIPGMAHFIASRLGLSFAYTVYLAHLYVESRDPVYAFTLAGGDVELARMMAEGKAEYPYGMLYAQKADRRFEGANMFVLGTFVKEKGYCLDGLVPEVARHELSRRGIVRCMPGGTLIILCEKYKELQKYDADLRAIVAWADGVCEMETAQRMSEAAMLVGPLGPASSSDTSEKRILTQHHDTDSMKNPLEVKVVRIGTSYAMVVSKEVLDSMSVKEGDTLIIRDIEPVRHVKGMGKEHCFFQH
jgi:hypothetical protein